MNEIVNACLRVELYPLFNFEQSQHSGRCYRISGQILKSNVTLVWNAKAYQAGGDSDRYRCVMIDRYLFHCLHSGEEGVGGISDSSKSG